MKRFVCKCTLFGIVLVSLMGGITWAILFGLPAQFDNTYQHALYLQTRAMSRIGSPKIVVMGDSSVPFSLDCSKMSKILKRPVQTLGIHSGTGIPYILDLSKRSVRRGDIMVLELTSDNEDSFSPSIVLTACENHFEMYRSFTSDDWGKVIRYYPSYLIKKVKYYFRDRDLDPPSYSISSFDHDGNYDYPRAGCLLPAQLQADERDEMFSRQIYSESLINSLNDYDRFCVQKGATFLITFPPFLNESLVSGQSSLSDVQNYLSHRLNAPVITQLEKRNLPRRYFYDNVTHCNTAGAEKVTEDLSNDILSYLNRGKPKAAALGKGKKKAIILSKPKAVYALPKAKSGSHRLPRKL